MVIRSSLNNDYNLYKAVFCFSNSFSSFEKIIKHFVKIKQLVKLAYQKIYIVVINKTQSKIIWYFKILRENSLDIYLIIKMTLA